MDSGIGGRADFSELRYGQCWEDTDTLLEGLAVSPGDVCLSIASAGDNTLALLTREPCRVLAVDVSAAQMASLELRIAAFRHCSHPQMLELLGLSDSSRREALYRHCRHDLSDPARDFWDRRLHLIRAGSCRSGRMERYLALFHRRLLPLVHPRARIDALFGARSAAGRQAYFESHWNTWRWRALCGAFFSRAVMGRLGRDPEFFRYCDAPVGQWFLARLRRAMTVLEPRENPYLRWILTGEHADGLPFAFRRENFDAIRGRLDRIELHRCSLERLLDACAPRSLDRCNLSNIFEYMAPAQYAAVLERLARAVRPGGRLVYWNLLVPRRRPAELAGALQPLGDIARRLHARDRTFFYRDFVVEQVT